MGCARGNNRNLSMKAVDEQVAGSVDFPRQQAPGEGKGTGYARLVRGVQGAGLCLINEIFDRRT